MNEEQKTVLTKDAAQRYFFKIGLALLLLRVLTTGVQRGISYIIEGISPELYVSLVTGPWFLWALSILPLYLVALPVFYLALPKKLKDYEPQKMSLGNTVGAAVSCVPAMYIGNIIGIVVVAIFSALLGHNVSNGLVSMIGQSPMWLVAICTAVIAPIGEEFIFRKLLIDRLAPFGELQAVLFSGLVFGLFHGNFNQFFYAALVGVLLAYTYVRTKNIIYPIIMHMCMNFFGSIIAPSVLSDKVYEVLDKMTVSPESVALEDLTVILPLLAFFFAAVVLFVAGIAFIAYKATKVKFSEKAVEIEGGASRALWSNPAVIVSMVAMALMFIPSLI